MANLPTVSARKSPTRPAKKTATTPPRKATAVVARSTAQTTAQPVVKPGVGTKDAKPTPRAKSQPTTKPKPKPEPIMTVKTLPPKVGEPVSRDPVGLDVVSPEAKDKPHKAKLVRDSFTMPHAEYAVLGKTKKICLQAGIEIRKSELLRIGVSLVGELGIAELRSRLALLTPLKTGRPKKA